MKWLAIGGAAAWAAGAAMAWERGWANLLLAGFFVVCLGLAGLFFVALNHACAGGWSAAIRRVPEAMTAALPLGGGGVLLALLLRPAVHAAGFKGWWLGHVFLLARAAVYILVWIWFARRIVGHSRAQDQDGNLGHTRANARLSVAFLVVFALSFWLASFDWIMALEPEFASTIFGVYQFAGMFSAGLAMIVLLARNLASEEHRHDLGKLLFAFSTFWMYIWFSQYMLIWYANIPEESAYFVKRTQGAWGPLMILNVLLNWGIPFLVLLPRRTKRDPVWLGRMAIVVLAGRWVDLYLAVLPTAAPALGLAETGAMLCAVAVFLMAWRSEMRQAAPAPRRDPYMVESLHYRS